MVVKGAVHTLAALVVALSVGVVSASANPVHTRQPAVALSPLEQGVLDDINAFRRQHGLVALRLSTELTDSARQHSEEMAADGYFAHTSHDGAAFWQRIEHWYAQGSYGFWSVGENLLWSSPSVTAGGALELWEHSPEHLRNLLTARWREIGVSAVHVDAGPGVYHGLPVTIVTTDFGVRH